MTFGTVALRVLSFVSLWATAFWIIAFGASAFIDPPKVLPVVVSAFLLVSVFMRAWFRLRPDTLMVPAATDWIVLLRRLLVGGVIAYVGVAALTYLAAVSLLSATGGIESPDAGEVIAILVVWAPMWVTPLIGSVLASRWSRADDAG